MASSYPGGIDSLPNPATSDSMAVVSHAGQHADANDAIEAIETELGTNPSGASASVKDRFDTVVVGPGSATDNALARFDGTTGKLVQNSGLVVDDSNNISGVGTIGSGAITSSGAVQAAAASGFVSGASGPKIGLSGTGSPEGVVTAPVGSEYTDTTTALEYRKATGTGNTGWAVDPTAWLVNTTSGRWLMAQPGAGSNVALDPDGEMILSPFPVYRTMTLDRLGINHAVAGSAGALWRLGIYRLDTSASTMSLVVDGGTIDATQAAGFYSVTISQQLTPGLYGLAVATQGAAGTKPQLKAATTTPGPMGLALGTTSQANAYNNWSLGIEVLGATGALPASPSWNQVFAYQPMIQVRVA